MTNKEAIKILQEQQAKFNDEYIDYGGVNEAYKLAIEALEDEPQGKWVEDENGYITCNKCGCEIRYYSYIVGDKPDLPKFCCDCGAKMQKGGTE